MDNGRTVRLDGKSIHLAAPTLISGKNIRLWGKNIELSGDLEINGSPWWLHVIAISGTTTMTFLIAYHIILSLLS